MGRLVTQSRDVADRMQRATLSPVDFMNRLAQGGLDWLQQFQGETAEQDAEHPTPEDRKKNR